MGIGTRPSGSRKPEVWGLTGGVASGKSLAARFLAELGAEVLDADRLARGLAEGPARAEIEKRFGTSDRARLRELVFADAGARRDLEAILHPLIRAESERWIAAACGITDVEAILPEHWRATR